MGVPGLGGSGEARTTFSSHDDKDRIRALVLGAMDQALQEHFRELFVDWVVEWPDLDDLTKDERARQFFLDRARRTLVYYREALKLLEEGAMERSGSGDLWKS